MRLTHSAALLVAVLCLGLPARAQSASAVAPAVLSQGNLEREDQGDSVRHLQAALRAAGQSVAVDGHFGPRTEAAVRAFQGSQGLHVDGIVGPRTARALDAIASGSVGGGTRGARGVLAGEPQGVRAVAHTVSPSQAYQQALAWARESRARGVRTLVVAFEGWISYSGGYSSRIQTYHDALLEGRSPSQPLPTGLSFVAKKLLVPNLPRFADRMELLHLPETSELGSGQSVAEQAVRAWHEVYGPSLNLVVTGHSFGAKACLRLARRLAPHGITVDGMLTIDSRARSYRNFDSPPNVSEHVNLYRKGPVMPGYEIGGARNVRLRGTTHGGIPGRPEVHAAYRNYLSR